MSPYRLDRYLSGPRGRWYANGGRGDLAAPMGTSGRMQPTMLCENRARSLRVLIVDDNVDAADSIGMLLEIAGHRVQVAYDGSGALEIATSFRPQVVLLDICMPGMDGYQVARRLREDPATREATLVAMTGWGQDEDLRKSEEAGFDRHLLKPAEPAVLEELLANLTRGGTE
ncbi:MAG: response regulator [Candidatus Binatia bacterium]